MAVGVGRRRGRKDRVIEDLQLREATTVSAFTWSDGKPAEPHFPEPRSWVFVHPATQTPPPEAGDLLGLTSRGGQVAVEGDVSLAHGQEVRADIWNDRGHAVKRQPRRHLRLFLPADCRNVQNRHEVSPVCLLPNSSMFTLRLFLMTLSFK